jgi:hypothetical protein
VEPAGLHAHWQFWARRRAYGMHVEVRAHEHPHDRANQCLYLPQRCASRGGHAIFAASGEPGFSRILGHRLLADLSSQRPSSGRRFQIVLTDDPDQAGALGYHEMTRNGTPLGKVFAGLDIRSGSSWTVTLSHELLEMLADPWINWCAEGSDGRIYALEVCDAVESDSLGYEIDGVLVSDFIGPPGSRRPRPIALISRSGSQSPWNSPREVIRQCWTVRGAGPKSPRKARAGRRRRQVAEDIGGVLGKRSGDGAAASALLPAPTDTVFGDFDQDSGAIKFGANGVGELKITGPPSGFHRSDLIFDFGL